MMAAQPAHAACSITTTSTPNDTFNCAANTTTTDTSLPANIGSDRHFGYSATIATFLNVEAGVTVDGFGLAMTNSLAGPNAVTITNNGTIQVNDSNTATAGGGDAALYITADGNPVIYSGTGNISNLGTGDGFGVVLNNGASLNATIGGNVSATTNAIDVQNNGAGAVTINSSGTVSSEGTAIVVTGTTGATAINVTAGSVTSADEGISYFSADSGAVSVALSGGADVTGTSFGIGLTSSGAKTVTIGAGSVVSGDTEVIGAFGGSTLTVTNSGTIGTIDDVAVITGFGTVATINNLAGGVLNGNVDLSDGADTITNAGTWNATGAQNFYAGADLVSNQAGGVINTVDGTTFTNLETLTNAGTINTSGVLSFTGIAPITTNGGTWNIAALSGVSGLGVTTNSGTINANIGSSIINAGNFTNAAAGTINTAGAFALTSDGTFANAGTLVLAPASFTLVGASGFTNSGTIRAKGGATSITTPVALANSGAIDLADGATNDVLTINGNFAGSGASNLKIDASSTGADRLVINGAASGSTVINVNPIGGVVINSDGILVVDTTTSGASSFSLGSTIGSSLIDFSLQRIGQDFFLFAAPNINAFDPLALINVAPDMWYQSADVYGAYSAQRRSDLGGEPSRRWGLWGQIYWGREHYGNDSSQDVFGTEIEINERIRTKRKGAQVGFDYNFGGGVLGLTGGWERADANVKATLADIDIKGWNLGAYGIVGSNLGFYGGLLVKYDHGKAELDNAAFDGLDRLTVKSWGFEGEAGYRWAFGNSRLDIGGGLAWVHSKVEDFSFASIGYDYDSAKSLRGRFGARFEGGKHYGPYVDARLLHEFRDGNDVTLLNGADSSVLERDGRGTWFRGEVGLGAHGGSGPMAAVWVDVGDVKGWGLRAGWRFGGGRAAMPETTAAPPPPPPSPQPTQSCPDGSVILATDSCPPLASPPPPPPPLPGPERG